MLSRRKLILTTISAVAYHALGAKGEGKSTLTIDIAAIDRDRLIRHGERYLLLVPSTITATHSPRSTGGLHDFYSEGDYWWPDPKNPTGPYIRRDGYSNPANFTAHREALLGLSVQMPALTAAWLVTGHKAFADHAADHLRAWFLNPSTRMNPNLQFAQAIFGVNTGRSIGVIDTVHLVEVARAATVLDKANVLTPAEASGIRAWFADYLTWLTTSKNGLEEREEKNNHGSCWVLQVAEFARYTGNEKLRDECRERYRTALIPNQLAQDGSLPLELARTRPYSYSLFDLDILATICQSLSAGLVPSDSLWNFSLSDGRGIAKAVAWMAPYIADKKKWIKPSDVENFEYLPARQASLLFAGIAYNNSDYLNLWKTLDPDPTASEVVRNFPIRQPILWIGTARYATA
jgi:hypothetical protein